MLKARVIFNNLENFNSILNYTIDDFTPSRNLSHMNKYGEILYLTPLKEGFNLRWYIQHLMDENKDEAENPLSEQNWMMQTNWKFIKFVIHHKLSMTSEKLKQKPFEEMIKNGHENLDKEDEESNENEQESTTSSEKSEQDSESNTSTEDEEESNKIQTLQVHHGMNETTHDEESSSEHEDDKSEENSVYEIESHTVIGEQNNISRRHVEKPLFMIGLISFCADQFSSVCSPNQRLLLYMYLSQLMSTFTNYLKMHHSLDGYFIQ